MKTSALPVAPISARRRRFSVVVAHHGGVRRAQLAATPVDLKFHDRFFVLPGPAKDILAASFGVPEDFVSLCFTGEIGLADGERRRWPRANPPGRQARPRQTAMLSQMQAENGKQRQSAYIGNEARPNAPV